MLVIVYLFEAKAHTVVPEHFIYCLNERSLKNRGVNSNQDRVIYFSTDCYEKIARNENVDGFKPNFELPITIDYPLPVNLMETCFNGRLYSFEGNYSLIFIIFGKIKTILVITFA